MKPEQHGEPLVPEPALDPDATGITVHLFGSLSATGKGHGTERAALAGVIGKEPAFSPFS